MAIDWAGIQTALDNATTSVDNAAKANKMTESDYNNQKNVAFIDALKSAFEQAEYEVTISPLPGELMAATYPVAGTTSGKGTGLT